MIAETEGPDKALVVPLVVSLFFPLLLSLFFYTLVRTYDGRTTSETIQGELIPMSERTPLTAVPKHQSYKDTLKEVHPPSALKNNAFDQDLEVCSSFSKIC